MYNSKVSFNKLSSDFNWKNELSLFSKDISKGFNFSFEACDRYSDSDKTAIYWEDSQGNRESISHQKLSSLSDRVAVALQNQGAKPGDRIATLMPRIPELYATLLAIWKIGAVYVPLFTAFGPEAIFHRLESSRTRFLFTHGRFRKNVSNDIPDLEKIIVVQPEDDTSHPKEVDFYEMIQASSGKPDLATVLPDDLAIILYTSGSTGMPKGAMLSYKFFIFHVPYLRYAVWLKPEDNFWCAADPAWAYGLLHTFVPLTLGNSILVDESLFTPERCYQLLERYNISNFAYAPTAFRALAAAGSKLRRQYDIRLRAISSAGEPLNADTVTWAIENFGVPIHDHYGFTEAGMQVNNYNCCKMETRPGSMGFPVPWHRAALIDAQGQVCDGLEPSRLGVHKDEYGTYFKGYWEEEQKTRSSYVGDWLVPGDIAWKDSDGYFWFEGRNDDVISSAGFRIGPVEVENSLMGHEAVMEAAVVGTPDPAKGEIVTAYVVLKPGFQGSEELARQISLFVKQTLSKHQYPRKIEFVNELPKTPSGKIQRFKLRALALQA
ncbi:MAG: AMP-binding protein [Proteobacteria bacterium]|nr:AMP-binding protein [Pseudomonadota bacterium]MBU1582850.1 AMP-binding protein [Pseudomonadota bacterium]MBU2454099.1 AMP-binding protein [Pseudomonadota bacterium]MBU2630453.1 AMP-binding protein [Pseudomonadota bacterium]